MEDGFYPQQADNAQLSAAITALTRGEMVVLTDTPDAGATVIMDAGRVSDATINFMATHCRGLIGVAVTPDRAARLGLMLQPRRNNDRARPSYTYSIEARQGVSTGISAADRALTIQICADGGSQPDDLVAPGHVFPQIAMGGAPGLPLSCAEMAIALLRAAGLPPVAATCSLLTATGAAAAPADAQDLASAFGLAHIDAEDLALLPRPVAFPTTKR